MPGQRRHQRSYDHRLRELVRENPELDELVPQAVAQSDRGPRAAFFALHWGHHFALLEKVKEPTTRHWYIERPDPDGAWMMQVARNLLDPVEGFLRNATHLIHDRDPLFTKA